jgi:hypothetical protein
MIPLGIVSGGGAMFDATKWSGLVGWWDTQRIAASDGATITTLTDYSYSSRNLTGSGTYTLNYQYGHPALNVGTAFTTSNFFSGYTEFTMIYVGYVSINAGNFFANATSTGYCMYTDGSTIRLHYPAVVWALQANWGSRWARVVMTGGSTGAEAMYENNSLLVSGSAATQAPGGNLSIGGAGMQLGEALIYNRVLTAQERTDIDTALATKWG